jgi:hypothetical protein
MLCSPVLRFRRLFLACLVLSTTGCARPSGQVSQAQTNLGWLGSMYGMFVGQHRGRTPKNIDELRQFIERQISAEELARLNVADAGKLFISPRDGKPFKMVSYAKLPPPVLDEPPPVVFYEEVGVGGNKAVAFLGGGTKIVDDATLRTMLPAGGQ